MGLIIPTGFHIFQRGRLNHQPVIYNHFGAISPNLGQLRYVFWDLRLNFGYTDNRYGTFFGETFDLKTISHQWSRWFRRSNLRIYIYIQRHIITVKALSPDIRTSCSEKGYDWWIWEDMLVSSDMLGYPSPKKMVWSTRVIWPYCFYCQRVPNDIATVSSGSTLLTQKAKKLGG